VLHDLAGVKNCVRILCNALNSLAFSILYTWQRFCRRMPNQQLLQSAVYLNVGGPGVYLLLGVSGNGPDESSL
jgi:hypothetical protein